MKTALEELIEALENNPDGRYFLEQYWVEDLVTKDQEQRAELIKAVAVESYQDGINSVCEIESNGSKIVDCFAEQYYNEVIKPKYGI